MRTSFVRSVTVRAVVAISTLALVGAACSDDAPTAATPPSIGSPVTISTTTSATTSTTTGGTAVLATTVPLTEDTVDIPLQTSPADGSTDIPIDFPAPPDTSDAPIVISVTVGVDADPNRIENIPIGATVALSVTNPTAGDEFHLHGYDLGDGTPMPQGQTETFTFTAVNKGQFELESHTTNAVLLVLSVG